MTMNQCGLLNKVIEGCFNEIYLIDAANSTYLEVSQIAQDKLGYAFEELQHMRPWQLARDFTQLEWQQQLEPLFTPGQQQKISISTYHTCKNGTQYPVLLNIMRDTSEGRDLLIVVGKDMSIQQRAITASAESDERCAAIVANLPGVVLQLLLNIDGTTRYMFLSANCESTLGVMPEILYISPSKFIEIILPEDRASYLTSMHESAQTQNHWNWEGRIWVEQWSDIKWIYLRAVPRMLEDLSVIWEAIITNITARKLIDVEIHLYRQRLTELSAHIERIKEQERMRIAREIHDEMGGNLVAVKMILHTLENRLPADQPWLTEKTHYVDTLIDRTIEAGHRIARDLRPSVLDLGLIPALDWQIKEFEKQYGIRCSFSTNKSDISLTPEHATAIFRMIQEALTNIAKHANATYASLAIIYTRTSISLTIADNGCGLETDHDSKPNSFGLLGMAERCKEIGGTILVDSQPNNGCVIAIKIPLIGQTRNPQFEEPMNDQLSLL
ncbi:PAS domain-containing sensor histidine kinase [Solimicrobium silvestre]|uniref:Histidine kinase n=1 Tax=Solimicrobium silvestre TaxID=2099400 RepID=A0A2S9GU97_9BURK|nr:histidine kinase [Solimicrobium silvestre]PRC91289.1 Histidine kinase [Solimicrobium silvestre]